MSKASRMIEQVLRGRHPRQVVEDEEGGDLAPGVPTAVPPTSVPVADTSVENPMPAVTTPSPSSPEDPATPSANDSDLAQHVADKLKGRLTKCDTSDPTGACCEVTLDDESSVTFVISKDSSGDTVIEKVRWTYPRPAEDLKQFRHDEFKDVEKMAADVADFLDSTKP